MVPSEPRSGHDHGWLHHLRFARLDGAGYAERGFYCVRNGFALATRLERLLQRGPKRLTPRS